MPHFTTRFLLIIFSFVTGFCLAQKPKATIISPLNNSKYIGGQVINLSATGVDIKEGNLPDDSFNWFVYLYHGTDASLHVHDGIASRYGLKSWDFEIPNADDHILNADVYYRFILVVTNSKGISDTAYSEIFPTTSKVSVNSVPPGMSASIFGIGGALTLPLVANTTVNNQFIINIPKNQSLGDKNYTFVGWGNGSTSTSSVFSVPKSDTTLTAIFSMVNGINNNFDVSGIKIFPNPVADYLNLRNLTSEVSKEFIIKNILGETIKKISNENINNHMEILVTDLNSGLYILELKSDENFMFYQFLKN